MSPFFLTRRFDLFLLLACGGALSVALSHPTYFSDPRPLGVAIFLQLTAAILWNYRERFFPFLILAFLWAGMPLPLTEVWVSGRWFLLALGAIAGVILYTARQDFSFRTLDLLALACFLAAAVSALVSTYPRVALLKAASLFLLFLFAGTGARLAVLGRETRFFAGLLIACEWLVYGSTIAYFVLKLEAFGNRNSLGVVMGVVAFPILLWGWFISGSSFQRTRRAFALLLCLLLLFSSYERAGIMAALLSSSILCLSLRRYRFLAAGLALALVTAFLVSAVEPLESGPRTDDGSLTSRFVYKGKREQGILGSRKTVWDQTLSSLRLHPWFGTGFGTSPTFDETSEVSDTFSSTAQVNREHGNSYLEIAEWVGLLGVAPFLLMLGIIATNVFRVVLWMRRTGSAASYSVPLAMFVAGALAHAAFEDWLFAAGYHTCVLFWSFAFVLPELVPTRIAGHYSDPRRGFPSPGPIQAAA